MVKCIFNREWPSRYPWVKQTDSKFKAHCHTYNLEEVPDFESQTVQEFTNMCKNYQSTSP